MEARTIVMSLALGALTLVVLSPTAAQAVFVQQPGAGSNGKHAAASEIRRIQRSTTLGNVDEVPPGMVLIPAGKVTIGTPADEVESLGQRDVIQMTEILAETPRHQAEVGPFMIDVTEVTNLQWQVFLEATGRDPNPTLIEFGWPGGEFPEGHEYYPITNVNIPEIRHFLKWSGKRLPTEEEWTRAARGDDDRKFPWGDDWSNKACQSGMNMPNVPVAVGSYPAGASPYGVLDMVGNVFEWVDSPFRAFPGFESLNYGKGRKTVTLVPAFNSTQRVIKGGAYSTNRQFSRIDVRLGLNTVDSDQGLGFRCARSQKPGVEAIRSAMQILQPPYFQGVVGLDEQDLFADEVITYDTSRRVLTGYRFLAFAHRASEVGKPWKSIYKDTRDDFLPLGVLATSEPLRMADMQVDAFPAGEYTLHFKAEGESRAFKDKEKARKEAEKQARKSGTKPEDDEPAPEAGAEPGRAAGAEDPLTAAVPWPGVASIHDIAEDIEYPQDADLILLMNSSNKVVGYIRPSDSVKEAPVEPLSATPSDGGRSYQIDFTLDQQTGKRSPRFSFTIHLAGDPL